MFRSFATSTVFMLMAIAVLTVGCGPTPPNPDCTCSLEIVEITVQTVDASDRPVTDLDIVVEVRRTREILGVKQSETLMENGIYVVFHDGFKNAIPPKIAVLGETLTVSGTGSVGDFEALFEVSVDSECRCHVYKISGPDTVVVE